ncbi:uncharacterized protein LOC135393398 [Ornithodoros turicata]|uniref:uncharacterized protein LOC135393398 n=1 Tax=Ornithodoros turicata TaxID=34597 RepID=UPI003139302C
MPEKCCVIRCRNMKGISVGVRFFRFPLEKLHRKKRDLWIAAIGRTKKDGTVWEPAKSTRVCGEHFQKGEPSAVPSDPDYVPNVFGVPQTSSCDLENRAENDGTGGALARNAPAKHMEGRERQPFGHVTNLEVRDSRENRGQVQGFYHHPYARAPYNRLTITQQTPRQKENLRQNAMVTSTPRAPLGLLSECDTLSSFTLSQQDVCDQGVVTSTPHTSSGLLSKCSIFESSALSKEDVCDRDMVTSTPHTSPGVLSKRSMFESSALSKEDVCDRDMVTSTPHTSSGVLSKRSIFASLTLSQEDVCDQGVSSHSTDDQLSNPKEKPSAAKELEVELRKQIEYWKSECVRLRSCLLRLDTVGGHDFQHYTGLPSRAVFDCLMRHIESQMNKTCKGRFSAMSHEESFFMVLVRLRTGMPVKEMSRNFGISISSCSRIFSKWIVFLHSVLKDITKFPTLRQIQRQMPHHFIHFPNTRVVIDATEIRMQRPSSHDAQRQTFSSYKHGNTLKVLVCATPDCYVTHISASWGGAASDRQMLAESGILEQLVPGDAVMVDKGFKIDDIIPAGVTVHIPPFKGANMCQMSKKNIENTRKIASARVNIERVIRRIKEFHILDNGYKVNMADVADSVVETCGYLSNFRHPL